MPLFRRRTPNPPTASRGHVPALAPAVRPAPPEEPDWRGYDGIAAVYERVHAPRTEAPARDLVGMMAIPAGGRVLDVGTGTGVAARAAAAAGASLGVGVDPSLPMLAAAAAHDPPTADAAREAGGGSGAAGPRFVAAEAIDLPFRASTFDAVVCAFALTHFARAETALFDMLRVLKPGGRMGLASWGPGDDEFTRAWNEVAEEFAEHEILQDAYLRAMPGGERFADAERLKDTLHQAGLRDIRIDRRDYRFEMTAGDYLAGRESAATGRFLRQMLGPELWEAFRTRTRATFAERFPPAFNDFREVILAAGHKPA